MSYLDSQQQAATVVQLDYEATTDFANGTSLPGTTWTDAIGNQTFSVDDPNSVVEVCVSGHIQIYGTGSSCGSRIVIDSGGSPITKWVGGGDNATNVGYNALAGANIISITGLTAGTHTIKLQLYASNATAFYCRAATGTFGESLQIRVLERKVLPSIFSGPQPTTKVQLDYAASTDISVSPSNTTWTDVIGNQTFTVDDPNSVVEIAASGFVFVNAAANTSYAARLVVDSAGTPANKMLCGGVTDSNGHASLLGGANVVTLTGLSAGSHTVKLQAYVTNMGGGTISANTATTPNIYSLQIRILERKQTAALVSNCMVKLAEVIVGAGGQASIAFSSIPGTYRSLQIILDGRGDAAAAAVALKAQFNADTGSNYDDQAVRGNISSASAFQNVGATSSRVGTLPAATATAGLSASYTIVLPNYARTTFQKQTIGTGGYRTDTTGANYAADVEIGFWRSTAAITSILLFPASGNFVQNSICSLYGIT